MFGLSGTRCHVCRMAQENASYRKDDAGQGLYWANPKISQYTDVRLDFCGPVHSVEWFEAQVEARKNVTQGATNQSAD